MLRLICRKVGDATSARVIEIDDPELMFIAPDEYARRYSKMERGDVMFVEVLDPSIQQNADGSFPEFPITLWRVECVYSDGVRLHATEQSTHDKMQKELAV